MNDFDQGRRFGIEEAIKLALQRSIIGETAAARVEALAIRDILREQVLPAPKAVFIKGWLTDQFEAGYRPPVCRTPAVTSKEG